MQRKSLPLRSPAGGGSGHRLLSPYAKALKHIALRGKGALGPTAREQEHALYLRGQLPADYRPPVQGRWDDTIERWTYAWQFPVDEQGESTSRSIAKAPEVRLLVDFCQRLLDSPPGMLPAAMSRAWPPVAGTLSIGDVEGESSEARVGDQSGKESAAAAEADRDTEVAAEAEAFLASLEEDATGSSSSNASPGNTRTASHNPAATTSAATSKGNADEDSAAEALAELEALVLDSAAFATSSPLPNKVGAQPSEDGTGAEHEALSATLEEVTGAMVSAPDRAPLAPGQSLAERLGVPRAYIDDGTELAAASKVLGLLLIEEVGLPYEPRSLASVITALGIAGYATHAEALFRFTLEVGFPASSMLYAARASTPAQAGNTEAVMAIIEEAKSNGVTPHRGLWHVLMRAFYRAGDYSAVVQVIDNMKAYANIEPDEQTFLHHLQALGSDRTRESAPFEAISLFDMMENTYGLIPNRYLYHAMMRCLSRSPKPALRTRVEELAKKMALLGMPWDGTTYAELLRSAQVVGDVPATKELFAKMRDERVPMTLRHLTIAANCYSVALLRAPFAAMRDRGESVAPLFVSHASTVFGMYELVLQRGWTVPADFIDALLRIPCDIVGLAIEHVPDDAALMKRFEDQATAIWEKTYTELGLAKSPNAYHHYIRMLGQQLRINEAEALFTELCLRLDMTPSARTYEEMMWMHLRSGEEGGTARALHYMEAMERAKMPIRPQMLRQFVRVTNAAAYRRDMKRRARRIMQAREEHLARREEGVEFKSPAPYQPPTTTAEGLPALTPLPLSASSTLAWWEQWKRESISNHELFETEGDDGMPRGEGFEEKNDALRKMGIESKFLTKADLPNTAQHTLLPALRRDSGGNNIDPAGSLWALDGGEMTYPKPGIHPQGWGTTLWRERQVLKKELQRSLDGKAPMPALSAAGNAHRLAPQQLAIEQSGARTPGDLSDALAFPDHVYDDGTRKGRAEMAFPVPHTTELVWQAERRDELSAFKLDEELAAMDEVGNKEGALASENTFLAGVRRDADTRVDAAVAAIRGHAEGETSVVGKGVTRRSKHDYLAKWREMYRHGTLAVPDEPVLSFGRDGPGNGHTETLAATVRSWYARNKRTPPKDEDLAEWREEKERRLDYAAARRGSRALRRFKRTARMKESSPIASSSATASS